MGDTMSDSVVGLLLSCKRASDYLEMNCSEFYGAVFSRSAAYQRYQRAMQLPLTLSSAGDDEQGTWRSVSLDALPDYIEGRNDAYVSACTYFPRKSSDGRYYSTNSKETASELCAFVLDIDQVQPNAFRNLLDVVWPSNSLPCPTCVVASGRGVHLWYVLDWPVKMLKRWIRELEHIQNWLGRQLSDENPTSTLTEGFDSSSMNLVNLDIRLGIFDRHGLTQPYRVVGSLSKDCCDIVTAWRIGETWDINVLAQLAGLSQKFSEDEFDIAQSIKTKEINAAIERSKAAAARAVLARKTGKSIKGHNPVFYPWFVAEAKRKAPFAQAYGSRYNVVMCLVIAAMKDNASPRQTNPITHDQIVADVRELHTLWTEAMNHATGILPIKWSECTKAIKCGYKFHGKGPSWKWMAAPDMCNWDHPSRQTRNGLSQSEHLAIIRGWEEQKYKVILKRDWRYHGGAPTKQKLIQDYAAAHPEESQRSIAKALGVSPTTVNKWLKKSPDE